MPTKFHYNPATGKSGPCRAESKECPLVSQYADGEVAHFETRQECEAFGEKVLAARYELEMKQTLQRKEQEYETAKLNYDLSQNRHTLSDDVSDDSTESTVDDEELARVCAEQEKNPMGVIPPQLAHKLLHNSKAVFLTKKPTSETYDNIAASSYFSRFSEIFNSMNNPFADPDDFPDDIKNPFPQGMTEIPIHKLVKVSRDVAALKTLESMNIATQQDAQSHSYYASRSWANSFTAREARKEKTETYQKNLDAATTAINAVFDTSTFPSTTFDNDVKQAVANNDFSKPSGINMSQSLAYIRESNDYAKKLTLHENNAVAFWTGTGSNYVAESLYHGKEKEIEGEKFDTTKYLSTLNSAIHKSNASEKVVYRGLSDELVLSSLSDDDMGDYSDSTISKNYAKKFPVGKEVTFKTPQSTTTNGNVSANFATSSITYAIKSKTNAPVGSISAYGIVEEEYIVPSDVKYKVTGTTTKTIGSTYNSRTMTFIEMEEI